MGQPTHHYPALLITAAFSRWEAALDWGRQRAEAEWGAVALESPRFTFAETEYYTPSMGAPLWKQFWAFQRLVDPADLATIKLQTNAWEDEFAARGELPVARPLNLDPGYLTLAKLVLASTKDHAHRIYLRDGIFAEVTLYYAHHAWQAREWTFADYRRADYHAFFTRCRDDLRQRSVGGPPR